MGLDVWSLKRITNEIKKELDLVNTRVGHIEMFLQELSGKIENENVQDKKHKSSSVRTRRSKAPKAQG